MQLIDPHKQLIRLSFSVAFLAGSTLPLLSASAQTPPIGKFLYEKLAKTQQDYRTAMATGDSLKVAEVCYLMGKRYGGLGDYGTAQKWFIRSLRIREPLGPSEGVGKIYLRMGEHRAIQNQYSEAMRYARRATANFQQIQSRHGMIGAFVELAGVHELGWKLNQAKPGSAPVASLDSALSYFRRAEQVALSLKKPFDIANVYACMGRALALNDANKALPYLKRAYAINLREKSLYGIINLSQQLADCYLTLRQPLVAQKWLDAAMHSCDTANHGDYQQRSLLEETYTKLYEQTGNWKQVSAHQKNYHALQIAVLQEDREGAIALTGMRYESEKNEAKLKAQQNELDLNQQNLAIQQRLSAMTTVLFILAGLACVFFYWLFRKYQRLSEHNAKLVKEQNHRVKNNLQSITNLLSLQFNRLTDPVARQAVEESLLRVEAMALVHRRLYDGNRLVEVNLREFIPELVDGVLRSYSLSYIQPLYTLSPIWLHADAAINLGLLLNELVTNSCKYALPVHPKPILAVGCQAVNGQIHVWFSDNGPGFTPPVTGNSFGMKLIDLITEKLKGKSQFSTDQGCHFTLRFNFSNASPDPANRVSAPTLT